MTQEVLGDEFGRRLSYLRLSVTDVCNFRCAYCLPNGYTKTATEPLRVDEVRRLCGAFAELGMRKVRVTGGEPTTRADVVELVREVARTEGIDIVALSTNGYRLERLAEPLRAAGLTQLNVSIDSLDSAKFAAITGHDSLSEVLRGVDAARAVGLKVKVNAVVMRDWNHEEVDAFAAWAMAAPITVRFIELMRTADNELFFLRRHSPGEALRAHLLERGWTPLARAEHAGPAVELGHPSAKGRLGLITPYSRDFCTTCNRLRVTSTGKLRLCLFGDGDVDLRAHLQRDEDRAALKRAVCDALSSKQRAHRLHQSDPGSARNLAQMGG